MCQKIRKYRKASSTSTWLNGLGGQLSEKKNKNKIQDHKRRSALNWFLTSDAYDTLCVAGYKTVY